ncbi:MAG: transporter permease [Thermomicrobiales bacterium]|nr:transporter permease [Thermomicrobiales bacterium]
MSANVSVETSTPTAASGAARLEPNELATLAPDLTSRPARSPWQIAIARFRRSKLALLGLLVITVMSLTAIFADAIAPYGENEIDLFNITAKPSAEHWLGTDELGRDELSRLIFGARVSLLVGVGAALISTAVGIVVGSLAGYYGGWLDSALMRFVDVILAFPAIFLLLIFFSIQGSSVVTVILFLGLFSWMWLARVIRGEFLSLKERDFIEAARSIGVPDGRLMWRHLLPNVGAAIIVSTTLTIAYAMLAEATLSFLGFGVPPGTPTWGNMLNAARPNYIQVPVLAIAPGLTLTIAVLAINFVGDGLRDALDPRGRG